VPFTVVHAGKYRTEDKLFKIPIQKIKELNTTQKNQTIPNTAKQNYPGFVADYNSRPGNELGSFYNAHEPTQGTNVLKKQTSLSTKFSFLPSFLSSTTVQE